MFADRRTNRAKITKNKQQKHEFQRLLLQERTNQQMSQIILSGFPQLSMRPHPDSGEFSGQASLDAQQYYAFRHNQFWRLLSVVLQQDLVVCEYPQKLELLLAHGIGLWDIFRHCVRQGSLDAAIRDGQLNDFATLRRDYPQLRRVCFNGKTAAKIQSWFQAQGYQTLVLPSSSPANAMRSFAEKSHEWQQILN
jgi:hypoxanthine-DNA glycosylase